MSCNHSEAVCVIGNYWACPICDEQKGSPESSEWRQMWTDKYTQEHYNETGKLTSTGDIIPDQDHPDLSSYYNVPIMIKSSSLKGIKVRMLGSLLYHKVSDFDFQTGDWKFPDDDHVMLYASKFTFDKWKKGISSDIVSLRWDDWQIKIEVKKSKLPTPYVSNNALYGAAFTLRLDETDYKIVK